MKKLLLLTISMVIAAAIFAADAVDIIVTKDARKIDAKILEVSKTEIRYKEADNQEGPTFIIETEEINSIIYSNGKLVMFNEPSAQSAPAVEARNNKANANTDPTKKNLFQNYVEVSGTFGQITLASLSYNSYYGYSYNVAKYPIGGVELLSTMGCRFNKYAFLGGGFGLSSYFNNSAGSVVGGLSIPIYADLRAYAPTKIQGFYPRFGVSVGPLLEFLQFSGEAVAAGFAAAAYFRLYGGLEYKRFSFGIGYELWGDASGSLHFGFISLGVRLGKDID